MTAKRRRTLRERAAEAAQRITFWRGSVARGRWMNPPEQDTPSFIRGYLAGYRAGKREGKAEAMKACGWGEGK